MDANEFEIKITQGRIINVIAERISDDTWKVIVETETFLDEAEGSIGFEEDTFALVEASKLSLDDKFLCFEPTTENEKNLKNAIELAMKSGVKDFYHSPKTGFLCNDVYIVDEVKKTRTHGISYEWWEKEAKNLCPERGSRLGMPKEYFAFIGAIIKDLVSNGISVNKAWHAVCEDPKELQFFWEQITEKEESSQDKKTKKFWSPVDFTKHVRILAAENGNDGFWMLGINYSAKKDFNTFTSVAHIGSRIGEYIDTVGWIVLTR